MTPDEMQKLRSLAAEWMRDARYAGGCAEDVQEGLAEALTDLLDEMAGTPVADAIEAGCRVEVVPREPTVFSMREVLRKYGKITGTVDAVVNAPYRIQLDQRPEYARWCYRDELTLVPKVRT